MKWSWSTFAFICLLPQFILQCAVGFITVQISGWELWGIWKDYQRWRMYDAESLLFLSCLTSLWMRNMNRKTIKWSSWPSPLFRTVTFSKLLEIRVLAGGSLPSLPQSIPHNSMWDSKGWILSCWQPLAPYPWNPTHCDWSSSDPTRRFRSTVQVSFFRISHCYLYLGKSLGRIKCKHRWGKAKRSDQGDYALLLCCSVESSWKPHVCHEVLRSKTARRSSSSTTRKPLFSGRQVSSLLVTVTPPSCQSSCHERVKIRALPLHADYPHDLVSVEYQLVQLRHHHKWSTLPP